MKKHFLLFVFVSCFCMNAYSQGTSMTVDCQNPGWLSSMINYGDQQTLTSLKVTGYLNASDLQFIGRLMGLHLTRIDMDSCNIVPNNALPSDMFNHEGHLQWLSLPLSVKLWTTKMAVRFVVIY